VQPGLKQSVHMSLHAEATFNWQAETLWFPKQREHLFRVTANSRGQADFPSLFSLPQLTPQKKHVLLLRSLAARFMTAFLHSEAREASEVLDLFAGEAFLEGDLSRTSARDGGQQTEHD
jgi:hypothetical protein